MMEMYPSAGVNMQYVLWWQDDAERQTLQITFAVSRSGGFWHQQFTGSQRVALLAALTQARRQQGGEA